MVLLKTALPDPYFGSWIVPLSDTNLATQPENIRHWPEFYVPIGTTNLALHKPVTASCEAITGRPEMVTDGDKSGDDDGCLELADGPQWVQIDLQASAQIYAVVVWHFYQEPRVYRSVIVAVSNDSEFRQDVKIIFNNGTENMLGLGKGSDRNYFESFLGKLIDAKGVKGRYVRLYSRGNFGNLSSGKFANKLNHYVEVEVFGKELKASK